MNSRALSVIVLVSLASVHAAAWREERAPASPIASPIASPVASPVASLDALALPGGVEAIKLDGELSEEIWTRAPVASEFFQRDPTEGAPASHPTEVRVIFDQTALYVAVRAVCPEADRIVGMLTRRDDSSPSDWIRVMVDSYRDQRTAYEFSVNAGGVKQDRYWFADTNSDGSWDAVWDVAVGRSAQGWRAEFRIPFSQLRFNPSTDTFGFAVVRSVPHVNETATWPLLAKSASGYVSSFGELRGVKLPESQKKLELMPYAVSQFKTAPVAAGNPLTKSNDVDAAVGLDLKYKVGRGLMLTGTVNPDFGQVEADPAVVNLGAFETFFSERRPFFVEGSGNLNFGIDCSDGFCTGLFYSRRIGRAPQRIAEAPDGGYAAQPANSTIVGAAKLTGRVGGFSVGALQAVTTREDARLTTGAANPITRTPVEPTTSYSIGRVNREFANRSRLGFMLTNTHRRLTDELRFLPTTAVTGGVDADWRLRDNRYSLTGLWAGSSIRGSANAIDRLQRSNVHSFQRPDAEHLTYDPTRTTLGGHAGSFNVNKISGQRTRFSFGTSYKTPGFEINDLGFQQRADEVSEFGWFQIRDDKPGKYVRSISVNFNQWAGWNFDGDRRFSGGNVNAHWVLTTNWDFGTGFNVNTEGFADRLTRGGPGGLTPGNLNQWGYLNSDNRKLVALNFFGNWFNDRHGSWGWGVNPGLTFRPRSALSISGSINVNRNVSDTQWIRNLTQDDGSHYVFGRINQTTVSFSTRVNYTITPTLSVQIYAAPFVSAGAYSNFRELVNGRAARYADRYAPFDYDGNPDFNYQSFRTTNVLRWEFRPGSALFVVFQQGREDVAPRGDFRFGRDFGDTFGAPATNVFLVKISRWLNF
jgi:hypothetical protein